MHSFSWLWKKGKEAYLISQKNRNKNLKNNSVYLSSSGRYKLFESNKKDNKGIDKYGDNDSLFKIKKYDEFSFKEMTMI